MLFYLRSRGVYVLETLKDIAEAWSQRARSPIIGSILLAAILINWQPLWYLLFAERPILQKFRYFDANTDASSLFWWPIVFGLSAAMLVPWIRLLGVVIVRVPTKLARRLQHDDSHEQRIYQLKKSAGEIRVQADLDEAAEEAKIGAAKRLERAREVGGDALEDEILERRTNERTAADLDLTRTTVGLLLLIASSDEGSILRKYVQTDDGSFQLITIGAENFTVTSNRQDVVLVAAIDELRSYGLLSSADEKITLEGYRYLDELDLDEKTQTQLKIAAREYFFE